MEIKRIEMLRAFGGDTTEQLKLRAELKVGDWAQMRNATEAGMVARVAEGRKVRIDFTKNQISIVE